MRPEARTPGVHLLPVFPASCSPPANRRQKIEEVERSGTLGRKLGAGVPASGLQQWELEAPGRETDTDTEAQGERNSQSGNKKQRQRYRQAERVQGEQKDKNSGGETRQQKNGKRDESERPCNKTEALNKLARESERTRETEKENSGCR